MSHPPAKRHSSGEKRMRERGHDTVAHPLQRGNPARKNGCGEGGVRHSVVPPCKEAIWQGKTDVGKGVRHSVVPPFFTFGIK